jgi:Angiotensin-converting enzyme
MWRDELEVAHLERMVDNLYSQSEPFYRQLRAFVRGGPSEIHGAHVLADQLIPSHLLGNFISLN